MQMLRYYFAILQMKENADTWNGVLPIHGKILIHEFEEQHQIVPFTAAIVRWEVYAALHVQVISLVLLKKKLFTGSNYCLYSY